MRLPLLIAAIATAMTASTATAHDGARVHVGVEGGQIKTYLGTPNTNEAVAFSPSRIFVEELPEFSPGIFLTDFPGFEARSASGIPTPTTFFFSIAGPLKYFDFDQPNNTGVYKTVSEMFSPGTVPQIGIRLNASNPWAISSTGTVTGHNFFTHNAVGDHGHVFFALFGNGAALSDGPDGVYAVPLTLNDSGGGLVSSETFWILFHKNVGTPELNAATAASPSLIPEPAAIGLLICGLPLLLGRRRLA